MSLCLWRGEPQQEAFLDVGALHFECWEEPTEIAPDGTLPFLLSESTRIFRTAQSQRALARSRSTAPRGDLIFRTAHAIPDVHDYGKSVTAH